MSQNDLLEHSRLHQSEPLKSQLLQRDANIIGSGNGFIRHKRRLQLALISLHFLHQIPMETIRVHLFNNHVENHAINENAL